MKDSMLMVRATLCGLVLALAAGCTTQPQKAAEESLTKKVMDSMYVQRMYLTGSRIPRAIDVRKQIDSQASQPITVMKPE